MYYLLIEVHYSSQISIVEPELHEEIQRTIQTTCTKWEMELHHKSYYTMYKHSSTYADEFAQPINAMRNLFLLLENYSQELIGYNLILESCDTDPIRTMTSQLLKIRERRGMYLGTNIREVISPQFTGKDHNGLWKIEDKNRRSLQPIDQVITTRHFWNKLLDILEDGINGVDELGEIHIIGNEYNGIHLIGSIFINKFVSEASIGKVIYAVLEDYDNLFYSIVRSIYISNIHWVEEYISGTNLEIWNKKKYVLSVFSSIQNSIPLMKSAEQDILILLQIYLQAYTKWSHEKGDLPLFLVYMKRSLTAFEVKILEQLMQIEKGNILWFLIFSQEDLYRKPIALKKINLNLTDFTIMEIHNLCKIYKYEDIKHAEVYSESKSIALYYFLKKPGQFANIRNDSNPASSIVKKQIQQYGIELREFLYLLHTIGKFLSRNQILMFYEKRGYSRIKILEFYRILKAHGVLLYEHIHNLAFVNEISSIELKNTDIIHEAFQFILNPENSIRIQSGLIRIIAKHSHYPHYLSQLYRYIQSLLNAGIFRMVEYEKQILKPLHTDVFELVNAQIALYHNELSENNIPTIFTGEDRWRGEWLILQSMLYSQEGRIQDAIRSCKSAIILFQTGSYDYSLSCSQNLFGYLYFSISKVQEANHYFSLTSQNRENRGFFNYVFAETMLCISNFVQRKYTWVKSTLMNGILRNLEMHGSNNWFHGVTFLLARTHFILGEYSEARKVLSDHLNYLRGEEQLREYFFAWIARCFIYLGKVKAGINIINSLKPTEENIIFKAEGYIIKEEFDDALSTLRTTIAQENTAIHLHPLLPWDNGFSWIEDPILNNAHTHTVLESYKLGITAYAMGNSDYYEDSVDLFYHVIREQKIHPCDPHRSRMLFWYSQILRLLNEEKKEDMITILALAVKSLQEESSNIEDPADKRSYLKNVNWNRRLFNTAKEHNLLLWE